MVAINGNLSYSKERPSEWTGKAREEKKKAEGRNSE